MAKYLYFCNACDGDFELQRPMREADQAGVCPSCGVSCARRPTLFGFVKSARSRVAMKDTKHAETASKAHVSGCPCCSPRRAMPVPAAQDSV